MTQDERVEYHALKHNLFGNRLFVVADDDDPEWDRYNERAGKFQQLILKLKNQHRMAYGTHH